MWTVSRVEGRNWVLFEDGDGEEEVDVEAEAEEYRGGIRILRRGDFRVVLVEISEEETSESVERGMVETWLTH